MMILELHEIPFLNGFNVSDFAFASGNAIDNPFIAIAGKHGITAELRIIPEIQTRRSKISRKFFTMQELVILRKTFWLITFEHCSFFVLSSQRSYSFESGK